MRNKRYNYYLNRVEEIMKQYPRAFISTKEKYWRFDITYQWIPPSVCRALDDMESESTERCQDCAKLRKQIWFEERWRTQHTCFRCYLLHLPNIIKRWIGYQRYKLSKKIHE